MLLYFATHIKSMLIMLIVESAVLLITLWIAFYLIVYKVAVYEDRLIIIFAICRQPVTVLQEEITELRYIQSVKTRSTQGFRVFVENQRFTKEIRFECMNSTTATAILEKYKLAGVKTKIVK